jgi:hypothetical protein
MALLLWSGVGIRVVRTRPWLDRMHHTRRASVLLTRVRARTSLSNHTQIFSTTTMRASYFAVVVGLLMALAVRSSGYAADWRM